jgi:UDP-3-O-[3-hydroxymyristoyl] glucosamine N-acyltransferase
MAATEEKSNPPFALSELISFLRDEGLLVAELTGAENLTLEGFSPFSDPRPGTVSWVKRQPPSWPDVDRFVVIAPADVQQPAGNGVLLAPVSHPRRAFAKALERFGKAPRPRGIEPTAVLGENTTIGDAVYIGHGVILGDEVAVGDGTVIYENVVVRGGCRIGSNCTIHAGTVIGGDGFGYERDEDGEWIKFQHIGHVVIEDEVEIGANTCIDRGALGATLIKRGAKIDNLCHIAHNVTVGERAFVIALTMVGGSTAIDDDAWIAPGAVLRNGIEIGSSAMVGLGALVLEDVPAGEVVAGVPAKAIKRRTDDLG